MVDGPVQISRVEQFLAEGIGLGAEDIGQMPSLKQASQRRLSGRKGRVALTSQTPQSSTSAMVSRRPVLAVAANPSVPPLRYGHNSS